MTSKLGWIDLEFWSSEKWKDIRKYLDEHADYLPHSGKIFKALTLTPLQNVRCVIIGQEPYHSPGMATGLAYSMMPFVQKLPPTLNNIFEEYSNDLGYPRPLNGDLTPWAKAGVLLLNSTLTVKQGSPDSHIALGWKQLVSEIVFRVLQERPSTAFIVWGTRAMTVVDGFGIRNKIVSPHPGPLSANTGFFGSKPFTRVNGLLSASAQVPIDWRLP